MSITIELEAPGELARLRLPKGVERRMEDLLDKQDSGTSLTTNEPKEAAGLVNLAELLSLLRVQADRAARF